MTVGAAFAFFEEGQEEGVSDFTHGLEDVGVEVLFVAILEDFEAGRLGRIPPNALMPHVPDPAPIRTERTGI